MRSYNAVARILRVANAPGSELNKVNGQSLSRDPELTSSGQCAVCGDGGLVDCGSPDRAFVPELSARQSVAAVMTITATSTISAKM